MELRFGTKNWIHTFCQKNVCDFLDTKTIKIKWEKKNEKKYYNSEKKIRELSKLPQKTWLIEGIIPSSGIGTIYGESGSSKTLTMALNIASQNLVWI